MLRNPAEREMRQAALRHSYREREQFAEETGELLDLGEVAVELKVSRSTARRLVRNEPGVHPLLTPGSSRPMIRVPRSVVERILRRFTNR